MRLTIVIPSYNEERRLPKTLDIISSYLQKKKLDATLLVVDDGSTDTTATLAKKKAQVLKLRKNYGKGAAVKAGILAVRTPWMLFCDADLSTPIEELEGFFKQASHYDILIASRNLPTSRIYVKQPLFRSILGKGFAHMVPTLLGLDISDTQCGFKLLRTSCAKSIMKKMQTTGWAFDAELLFHAKRMGLRIKEIPVRWENSPTAPIQMLRDVLKIRWRSFNEK
jgi:dolichyl-phosphate beta-glucosyltransferase